MHSYAVLNNSIYLPSLSGLEAPKVTGNSTGYEGKELELQCNVSGNPAPTQFQWFKDNKQVPGSSRIFKKSVGREDKGDYTCNVTNSFGEKMSGKFPVDVYCEYYY